MYHYVREFDREMPDLNFLHVDDFCKQLDFLGEEYGFITKQDFLESINLREECPKGVVLTFDDGLKDHLDFVLPSLLQRNLWGVFYVSSGIYSKEKMLPVQKTQFLLAKYGAKKILETINEVKKDFNDLDKSLTSAHEEKVYLAQDLSAEEAVVKKILNFYLEPSTKDLLTSTLLKIFGENEENLIERFYLSKQDIKILDKAGMILGGHGVSHQPMVNLSDEESEYEITESLEFLELLLGKTTTRTFCYPHGLKHTFQDREIRTLDKLCVDFSFAVESRDVNSRDLKSNIHALPRYDCNEFKYGSSYKYKVQSKV